MRLPSGATATPWFTSIPSITPTTLFVAGSITSTLSPALFVWMIRTTLFPAEPAVIAHKMMQTRTSTDPRNTRLFIVASKHENPLAKFAICYGLEYHWSGPTPTLSKFAIPDRFVNRNVCHRCGRNRRRPLRPEDERATDSSSRQASLPAKSPRNSCAIAHRPRWCFPPIALVIEKLPERFRPYDKRRNARGRDAWPGRSAVLWF